MASSQRKNGHLREIAALFFKLGIVAFGGPAAHIAMMEDEVVKKRKWMTAEHFLDLVGATNLIPGPNSTEMTMHCGYQRGGVLGLFVAGISFIFPAVVITGVLAYLYVQYGKIPAVEPFLYGIKPAVLAIIFGAIYKLGKKALKNNLLGLIGIAAIVANVLGLSEALVILGGGVLAILLFFNKWSSSSANISIPILPLGFSHLFFLSISNGNLFLIFLKIGAILFGSGYVLVAYLDGELVQQLGWLSRAELLEAIAIGQLTPGPVLSTSTFIGYLISGWKGAIAATLGIFLPSFLFVYLLNPLIPKLRSSKIASFFLDGVNIAAVAVMVVATFMLAKSALVNWQSILIAVLALVYFFGYQKSNVIWLVIGSSLLGYVLSFL